MRTYMALVGGESRETVTKVDISIFRKEYVMQAEL